MQNGAACVIEAVDEYLCAPACPRAKSGARHTRNRGYDRLGWGGAMKAVVSVDQGSSSTKSMAISLDGTCLGEASSSVRLAHPRSGWVEYDAEELWRSVEQTLNACLAQLPRGCSVEAVGVSNQRESVLLWDRRTGRPLGPCISWQCRRTVEICRSCAGCWTT
jgi:glycerol kinase